MVLIILYFFVCYTQLCSSNINMSIPLGFDIVTLLQDIHLGLTTRDVLTTTPDLLKKYGYPCEIHEVRTEDKYSLELHRVPYGPNNLTNVYVAKPVVFLMHDILCSSADWVYTGPNRSLALLLADAGYDVWLGNARGNTYSRKHSHRGRSDPSYWHFSWHEIGYYDLAASLDYVLQTTNHQMLYYVGYGQGSTVMYVLLSMRPQYNRRIKLAINLAPSAFMSNVKSQIVRFISNYLFVHLVSGFANQFGYFPVHINNFILSLFGNVFCGEKAFSRYICTSIIFSIVGDNLTNFNFKLIPKIFGHMPAPVSIKQLLHYGQEINSGHFRQFDYGYTTNTLVYGQPEPPDYDLSNVTCPMVIYYAENDMLCTPTDILKLTTHLGSKPVKVLVSDPQFNHIDFLWGLNAPEIVYVELIQTIMNN